MTRPCTVCKEQKPPESFTWYGYITNQGKQSRRRDSRCKECNRKRRLASYRASPASSLKASAAWKIKNTARQKTYAVGYRNSLNGKARRASLQRMRGDGLKQRTPSWADQEQIAAVYRLSAAFSALYTPHHVDHVVPLLGKRVSGLHVIDNLRVIPREDNQRKYNNFEVA